MKNAFMAVLLVVAAAPASAQLLEDRINDQTRTCVYVGTEQQGDQVVPRTLTLTLNQACPETAPYRDPNLPVPGNAALIGDVVENNQRRCTYTQAGIEYVQGIPVNRLCAMTPALLDQSLAERRPGD